MNSFEQMAALLEQMDAPPAGNALRVEWLAEEKLGLGRNGQGNLCVLLVGDELRPISQDVHRAIRHRIWETEAGRTVAANLLALPDGKHFLTAAAAIAAELIRSDVAHRPMAEVFDEVESFIALVLRRVLLPADSVLGLVGELIVLHELLKAFRSAGRTFADPTAVWRGCTTQGRDFVLGTASIEVKATRLPVSRHTIHGLDQVEARKLDGTATERLYIASIGLRHARSGLYSVAGLTDHILDQLRDDDAPRGELNVLQTAFLDRLASYGPSDSCGYIHRQMSAFELYQEAFSTTFAPRFYDMNDVNIRVVRSPDLAEQFQHVRIEGIAYTIELPPSIPGSINNPSADFRQLLRGLASSDFDV